MIFRLFVTLVGKPVEQVFREYLEGEACVLCDNLSSGQEIVRCDAIDPSLEAAFPIERGELGYKSDEDFLCGILGGLRTREHVRGPLVIISLRRPFERFKCLGIALFYKLNC